MLLPVGESPTSKRCIASRENSVSCGKPLRAYLTRVARRSMVIVDRIGQSAAERVPKGHQGSTTRESNLRSHFMNMVKSPRMQGVCHE